MREILEKINLRTKIIIGLCIVVVISFGVVFIKKKTNTPESTMDKYVNALIDGKYEEIIDLCYFPKSEFITDKKIESLKKEYYKKMTNRSYDITDCNYSLSQEDDKYYTYKVILKRTKYSDKTEYIKVRKSDSKIDDNEFYGKLKVPLERGATLYVDGKKVNVKPKIKKHKDGIDEKNYYLTILSYVKYDFNVKHPVYEYDNKSTGFSSLNSDDKVVSLDILWSVKDKYRSKIEKDVGQALDEIAKANNENGNIEDLNKYFKNNNAKKFLKTFDFTDENANWYNSERINYSYKRVKHTIVESAYYTGKNKMLISAATYIEYEETAKDVMVTLFDKDGKIVSSCETYDRIGVDATWEYIDGKWIISTWENN